MTKVRVGVLRGGPSGEYDVSLRSGESVLMSLPEGGYEASDVLISKDGTWNVEGLMSSPSRTMRHVDVIFNALHGEYGEDGKIQQILEGSRFPFTGSKSLSSAFGMNKLLAKRRFISSGLQSPQFVFFEPSEEGSASDQLADVEKQAHKVFLSFGGPWVIKPVFGGSSLGIVVAHDVESLVSGLLDALTRHEWVFVEKQIFGREATCGVIDDFREREHFALPPLEIKVGPKGGFFDYTSKYDGSVREVPYGDFSGREIEKIQGAAIRAHKALGLRHYSRSDMIVTPEGDVMLLETNSLPGLTKESLLPKSLYAAGISFPTFLDHTVRMALENK